MRPARPPQSLPSPPPFRTEPRPRPKARILPRLQRRTLVALILALVAARPIAEVKSAPQRPPEPGQSAVLLGDARFLIVGLTQDEQRTDTIMVVQWDDLHRRVRMLSVPRDIGIPVSGIGTTKVVHAYTTGGIGRTRIAVGKLLGVSIPHYFVFSLPVMRHLVDLIGGVPINVEKRMVYTDRKQGLYINLYPGPQVLDGPHAEQYLRFRHDADADIGRIRRQQQFFRAALAAVHRPNVWIRLPWILSAVRDEVDTDLTSSQLLDWVRRVQGLAPDAITSYTIAGRNGRQWDALQHMKLDFWVPDPDDLHAKVRWLLTGELPPDSAP